MKNARSILGMPVVKGGRKIGRVTGVDYNRSLRALAGVWVYCGVRGTRYIARTGLSMLGDVALLATQSGKRTHFDEPPLFRRALSTSGGRVGAITDALIDENTLEVPALELSLGYLDDFTGGRQRVWQFKVCDNGDVIIEQPDAVPEGRIPT